MTDNLTNLQDMILKLISYSVFNKMPANLPDISDFSALYEESKHQAVIGQVFTALCSLNIGIEKADYNKFLAACTKIEMVNEKLLRVQNKVLTIIDDIGVSCCVIKGIGIAVLYPEPQLRMSADVDILVAEKDYDRVNLELQKHNYKGKAGKIHMSYFVDGKSVEIHRIINGIPDGEKGSNISSLFKNIGEISQKTEYNGYIFNVPKPEYTALILLLHMFEHMTSGGIGIRHLCDFAVFADRYLNEKKNIEDCRKLVALFKACKVYHFASIMTDCCIKAFSLEKKDFSLMYDDYDGNLYSEVIYDIFEGGIYGNKKIHERYLSELVVKDEDNCSSGIVRFFRHYKTVAGKAIPAAAKFYPLYIVAFIYVPVRYIFRVISGKRKSVNPFKMLMSADKRHGIYKKFNMFKK